MPALPDAVCAQLRLAIRQCPAFAVCGSTADVRVEVENGSREELGSFPPFPVQLSYRWFRDGADEAVVAEGLRTALRPPVSPGGTAAYWMRIAAPAAPGRYRLRVTLVQEFVRWLDEAAAVSGRGSSGCRRLLAGRPGFRLIRGRRDRVCDRTHMVPIANHVGVAAFSDALLSKAFVDGSCLLEVCQVQRRRGRAQALGREGLPAMTGDRRLHLRTHLHIRRAAASFRSNATSSSRIIERSRAGSLGGRAVQQELVVVHVASRPPADDVDGAVDDQPADIVGRIESFDRVSGDAIHARLFERVRKLLRDRDEHVDASLEQQPVDLFVRIAAVDRSDRRADVVEQPVVEDRREVAAPPEPSVRQQ